MAYVLGINGGFLPGYQDASTVLVKDGEVIFACEEERLSRIKYSPGQLPLLSIKKCLSQNSITIYDIDLLAFHGLTWTNDIESDLKSYFQTHFGYCPKIKRFHHHLAHAASTYYASGFSESLIITYDCSGDGVATQIAIGKEQTIDVVKRYERPNSLGLFYSMITQFCGFIRDSDEYKLMGLSSFGDPNNIDLSSVVSMDNDDYIFNDKYLVSMEPGKPQPHKHLPLYSKELIKLLGKPRLRGDKILDIHKDIAASAQKILNDVILEIIQKNLKKYNLSRVCIAGGVGLNCVVNKNIMNMPEVEDLYVQPASGDAGISLGCAYLGANHLGSACKAMKDVYLGTHYTDSNIKNYLDLCGIRYKELKSDEVVSKLIAQNKVVGLFSDKMEFGPRALGNRSIIANPCSKDIQTIVNKKIKFRESFRPFCPSVLEDDACIFFKGKKESSPFMTITYDVKENMESGIQGVTHIDNTARIQTVSDLENTRYCNLLKNVKNEIGKGVLLNTSFNRNNEPIVESPIDAISCFYGSGMDALVLGSFLIEK